MVKKLSKLGFEIKRKDSSWCQKYVNLKKVKNNKLQFSEKKGNENQRGKKVREEK